MREGIQPGFASEFAKQELFRSSRGVHVGDSPDFFSGFSMEKNVPNHGQTANPMKYKLSIDDPLIFQLIISLRSH